MPQTILLVVEHIGVAGLALQGQHGVARIYFKGHAVVAARCEALYLTCGRRRVHRQHGILAESGRAGMVDGAAAAEYRAEAVGLYGRGRVSPGHVLPFGAVRIPLIIQMPYPVLVEHAVGIVHPPVEGGVMVCRTILLRIGGIESIGERYGTPARIVLGLAHVGAVLRTNNVEHHVVPLVR